MLGERENVMLDVRALHLSSISGVAEMNRSPQEPDSEAERSDLQSRRVTLSLDDSDSESDGLCDNFEASHWLARALGECIQVMPGAYLVCAELSPGRFEEGYSLSPPISQARACKARARAFLIKY